MKTKVKPIVAPNKDSVNSVRFSHSKDYYLLEDVNIEPSVIPSSYFYRLFHRLYAHHIMEKKRFSTQSYSVQIFVASKSDIDKRIEEINNRLTRKNRDQDKK